MPSIDWSGIFSFHNAISHLAWAVLIALIGRVWQKVGGKEIWKGNRWVYWPVSILTLFVLLTAFSRPDLPDFSRSQIGPYSIGLLPLENEKETVVTMDIVIINTGSESAIYNYAASLRLADGSTVKGVNVRVPDSITLRRPEGDNRPPIVIQPSQALVHKTEDPISRGRIVDGVIVFVFPKLEQGAAMAPGNTLSLTFFDAYGRRYTLTTKIEGTHY